MMVFNRGLAFNATSQSFQERGVLDVLGHNLRRVYGEPEREDLPDRLQDLVARLEQAEREDLIESGS